MTKEPIEPDDESSSEIGNVCKSATIINKEDSIKQLPNVNKEDPQIYFDKQMAILENKCTEAIEKLDNETSIKFVNFNKHLDEINNEFSVNKEENTKFTELHKEFTEENKKFADTVSKFSKEIKDKDEELNIVIRANVQMVLVDMSSIAEDLNYADKLLLNIGTEEHFEKIRYEEKHRGTNMAYQASKRYLEQGASNARKVMPILESIKITLDKLNEKLYYMEEA